MHCVKVEGRFNNYQDEINRIIKEKRKKNMYLKDARVEKRTILLVFETNENKENKKRNIAVQGKIRKYKNEFHFIMTKTDAMRSFKDHMYIIWSVDKCLQIDGKYLLFLSRKRKGYHRSRR